MTSLPNATTPGRIALCRTTDVAEGTAIRVEHGDLVLAVYNVGGEYFVTDDMCTHGPGSLSEGYLEDDEIECNFHGGRFNVRTGLRQQIVLFLPEHRASPVFLFARRRLKRRYLVISGSSA